EQRPDLDLSLCGGELRSLDHNHRRDVGSACDIASMEGHIPKSRIINAADFDSPVWSRHDPLVTRSGLSAVKAGPNESLRELHHQTPARRLTGLSQNPRRPDELNSTGAGQCWYRARIAGAERRLAT